MMNKVSKAVRAVRAALQPYRVVVQWEGRDITHKAWTRADALEWAAAYPRTAHVAVFTRSLRLVCERGDWL